MTVTVTKYPAGPAGYPHLKLVVDGVGGVKEAQYLQLLLLILLRTESVGACYTPDTKSATFCAFITTEA